MQELYLRKNKITDVAEVKYLVGLGNLKVLWLSHNPCAEHQNYRKYIVKMLPQLIKLDNQEISQDEKQQCSAYTFDQLLNQENGGRPTSSLTKKSSQASVLQQNSHAQNKSPLRSDSRTGHTTAGDNAPKRSDSKGPATSAHSNRHSSQKPQTAKNQGGGGGGHGGDKRSNENIVCAVLALLKELGEGDLELIRKDVEKKLSGLRH